MGVGPSGGRVTPSCPRQFFGAGPGHSLGASSLWSALALQACPSIWRTLSGAWREDRVGGRKGQPGPGRRGMGGLGGGVTVGQQPRPARVGARAEGTVPSGQRSEAVSRGLSGLPNLFLSHTHSHTHKHARARAHGYPRCLHARIRRGHTPT